MADIHRGLYKKLKEFIKSCFDVTNLMAHLCSQYLHKEVTKCVECPYWVDKEKECGLPLCKFDD